MPEPVWISLMAWRYLTRLTSGVAIADALDSVSPDRLTRRLHDSWSGQTRRHLALRTLGTGAGGPRIRDATVVCQP